MNKHYIIFIFLVVIAFFSCRKDDICTQGGTSKLGISFYDFSSSNNTLKSVNNLSIIALPNNDTLVKNIKLDFVGLPLNTNSDTCQFLLINSSNSDTLTFSYQRKNVFVSKSCGYKTVFNLLNIDLQQDNDNWIKNIEIINQEITTDTTHVKIYH